MTILRLSILVSLLLGSVSMAETAIETEELVFDADDRKAVLLRYAKGGNDTRPAVLLLHGASGFLRFRELYERHAMALTATGHRVYVVMYYSDSDHLVMTGNGREARRKTYRQRFESWVQTTADALEYVTTIPSTDTDNVAVLGFSQGAYIAVGVAGTDRRVTAIVVKYGGLPSALADRIDTMPPTLIIHGEADDVVPLSEAYNLAQFLDELCADYVLKTYADAGHGFDARKDSETADDSVQLTVDFLNENLKTAQK
jgi:carboxymethylenebutenolidase